MINRKIQYFITLAECLSFTQTALHYDVSQTAISRYIQSLEERLGIRLFERDKHSVVLTEAGKYYYERVKRCLDLYDDTLIHMKAISEGYKGYLKVGVGLYEYCSTEGFFSSFLTEHPEIKVEIWQYPYSTLTEKLRKGELDIILGDRLCEDAFARQEVLTRTLFVSPNFIASSPEVAQKYNGDVEKMLSNECLITNCEVDGPSSLQMLAGLMKSEYGFVPENIAQTNSVDAQLMMVRAHHGVAMVPGFVTQAQGQDLICFELPSRKMIPYNLMRLKENENKAAELLLHFKWEKD